MHASPEHVALVQREREQDIRHAHLAAVAACHRACCQPSLMTRLTRAIRHSPAAC